MEGAPPAFLFFGVFTGFEEALRRARALIVERFGPLHPRGESPVYPFPETRTYARSMGPALRRQFFVVDRPWPQEGLAPVKHAARAMEEDIRRGGSFPVARPVNIDPGLLNDCRIILASTRDHAHRIYRGDGIWEEITLVFQEGEFRPHPWTYPDFRASTYHAFFAEMRREILARFRSGPPPG